MNEEKQLEALKRLSARAILEFDDVNAKYAEYYEKFCKEEEKFKKLDSQFKQLKQVSLLAVSEYDSLQKQYAAENKYRAEIEEKLRKVTEENLELQKQKNSGFSINAMTDTNFNGNKGDLDVLRSLKDAVNDELRKVKKELALTKEELTHERNNHKITQSTLNANIQEINQLKRVSAMALDEFSVLKLKFDIEKNCREKAEEYAIESLYRTKTESRKSRAMMASTKDSRIEKFMQEIDDLTAAAEKERKEFNNQIKELQNELATFKNTSELKVLQDKVSLLMDELDLTQKQLEEAKTRALNAEHEVSTLFERISSLEKKLEGTSQVQFLPPPPPPPPPPIAAPIIRKLFFKIGKKKKTKDVEVDDNEEARRKAMEDMIDRIKKGVKLRSVASPLKPNSQDENVSAMGELAGLLTNMRSTQPNQKEKADATEKQPEFATVKLRKASSFQSSTSVEESVSELKKILQRQKTFAEVFDAEGEEGSSNILNNVEVKDSNSQEEIESFIKQTDSLVESLSQSSDSLVESSSVQSNPSSKSELENVSCPESEEAKAIYESVKL
ncbi:shootin-1 isoform X1 [Hydra vulgaris]|uniref:shootin-1 isoform X1 n=1 Tax=Hydra vulgaris TaxID=6087 RepID=UPI001F5F70BF|nr:shootin-1 [Hydra vulgaris]